MKINSYYNMSYIYNKRIVEDINEISNEEKNRIENFKQCHTNNDNCYQNNEIEISKDILSKLNFPTEFYLSKKVFLSLI